MKMRHSLGEHLTLLNKRGFYEKNFILLALVLIGTSVFAKGYERDLTVQL
jgi:hypothetical protein